MLEAIGARRSVRTYDGRPFSEADRGFILSAIASPSVGPFGSATRFALLEPGSVAADGTEARVGTYGVIRGAAVYVAVVAPSSSDGALFDAGFSTERFVLDATRRGLGSCWLGGTFRKGPIASAVALGSEEKLVALIALGYPAGRRAFMDVLIFTASGRGKRKENGDLFRDVKSGAPLEGAGADFAETAFGRFAAAVRAAPSASNKQPWRFVADVSGASALGASGDLPRLDLYLERDASYEKLAGYRIQTVDAGIVSCHVESAAAALGFKAPRRTIRLSGAAFWENTEFVIGWDFSARG